MEELEKRTVIAQIEAGIDCSNCRESCIHPIARTYAVLMSFL